MDIKKNDCIIADVNCEIYGTILNIVIHDTIYDSLKAIKCLDGRNKASFSGLEVGMFGVSKSNNWVILLKRDKISAGTIAHECFHATKRIMEAKNMYLCDPNEEAYAYLLDWIVEKTTEVAKLNGLI